MHPSSETLTNQSDVIARSDDWFLLLHLGLWSILIPRVEKIYVLNFILCIFLVLILTNIMQFYPSELLTLSQHMYWLFMLDAVWDHRLSFCFGWRSGPRWDSWKSLRQMPRDCKSSHGSFFGQVSYKLIKIVWKINLYYQAYVVNITEKTILSLSLLNRVGATILTFN